MEGAGGKAQKAGEKSTSTSPAEVRPPLNFARQHVGNCFTLLPTPHAPRPDLHPHRMIAYLSGVAARLAVGRCSPGRLHRPQPGHAVTPCGSVHQPRCGGLAGGVPRVCVERGGGAVFCGPPRWQRGPLGLPGTSAPSLASARPPLPLSLFFSPLGLGPLALTPSSRVSARVSLSLSPWSSLVFGRYPGASDCLASSLASVGHVVGALWE